MKDRTKRTVRFKKRPSTTLRTFDYIELGFAKYDLKREKIKGFPEVILALGKSNKQLTEIISKAIKRTKKLLVTKTTVEQYEAIRKAMANKVL